METYIMVYVDMPGVDRSTIDLSIDDKDTMIIKVNRKLYSESSDTFHLRERYEGCIEKRVKLPSQNLDKTSIKANYEDGVLNVQIKKVTSGQNSTRIPIS
jgi:HSP20 family molecular chaperone IbpA